MSRYWSRDVWRHFLLNVWMGLVRQYKTRGFYFSPPINFFFNWFLNNCVFSLPISFLINKWVIDFLTCAHAYKFNLFKIRIQHRWLTEKQKKYQRVQIIVFCFLRGVISTMGNCSLFFLVVGVCKVYVPRSRQSLRFVIDYVRWNRFCFHTFMNELWMSCTKGHTL